MENTANPIAFVLFSSPRRNGATKKILDSFLSELRGYDTVIFDAYEENVRPCIDCRVCANEDRCVYSDCDEIDYFLRNADLLIVATPVYNLSFPAPLKAVFDRMQRYFSAKFSRNLVPPIEKTKKAVLILTAGADSDRGFEIIQEQLRLSFCVINAQLQEKIFCKGTDKYFSLEVLYPKIKQVAKSLSVPGYK